MTLCESSYTAAHQELAEDDDAQRQAEAIRLDGEERRPAIVRPFEGDEDL